MRRERCRARQAGILLLICGGHVALYSGLSPELSPAPTLAGPDGLTVVLVPRPIERPVPPRLPAGARSGAARVAPALPAAPSLAQAPQSRVTDWAAAVERAAHAATVAPPRRGFGMPQAGPAPPPPRPEFGWSHARTHPIDTLEGGGFVYNINDRCSIVVVFIPLPFCRMGKIPPRGDLLDHRHDGSAVGDWKDGR